MKVSLCHHFCSRIENLKISTFTRVKQNKRFFALAFKSVICLGFFLGGG